MADVIERVICDKADLVAIADNVRACNGESDTYSVLTLNDAVQGLSEDIDEQADLISQIQTALEGKAAGGGGGTPETCTVTLNMLTFGTAQTRYFTVQEVSTDGTVQTANKQISCTKLNSGVLVLTVLKGSMVLFHYNGSSFNSDDDPSDNLRNVELNITNDYFKLYTLGQEDTAEIKVYP